MRLWAFFLVVLPISSAAQIIKPLPIQRPQSACSTYPGMTPQTAIAVCGTTSFYQNSVNSCTGPNVTPSPCAPDIITSDNSFWYKFHCYSPGTLGLGFLIKPGSNSDDFDWTLFDVTGHTNLDDVFTMGNMQVSVNISGILGNTGCTPTGTGNVNCAGSAYPPFNQLATVRAGHDYMLMVTNWSNSGLGYSLVFTGGDAVITDNILPTINSVNSPPCVANQLQVAFSKDILCSTVTASGSEFSITPGNPVITGVTSQCSGGNYSITGLTINLQNPLASGNYTLVVNPGSDGNTFKDACGDSIVTGFQIPFTETASGPVNISAVNYSGCAPTVLNIALTRPVWCSSVTPSGSEFSILPGNPVIASVQSACTTGAQYTDTLHIMLQNPLPPGNYQLLVNNGTDGDTFIDTCNNTMPPGTSTSFVITQSTVAPVIQTIGFDQCQPDRLVLNFDKPVACTSLTSTGSEFSISPGVWPVNSIISSCVAGTITMQVTLLLQNTLPAGNFTVHINTGSDGNTLSDTCFAFIAAGYTKSFVTTQAPAPKFDSLQFDKCNPAFVKVFYSHPIRCSSISPDGSNYSITGPGTVNITSARTDITCAQGYTNWVLLQFAQPINSFGNYILHNGIGTNGSGIMDTCQAAQLITETISFTVLTKPSAAFNSQVNWGCVVDTLVLFHPGGNGINSWTWNFSDGSTASGQTVTHTFPDSTATTAIQLIVSNGSCSDTVTRVVALGNTFRAAFTNTPKDTSCSGIPISITNTSTGNIASYFWDFGDGSGFNGQNPPAHSYPAMNTYTIQLIAVENHGCRDSVTTRMVIDSLPVINFTGLNAQYCVNDQVSLSRIPYPDFISFTWDNGDGKIFTNNPSVVFSYPNEGLYTIKLTGIHKYCGVTTASKVVPVYAVPKINLGKDTILCPETRITIGVLPTSNYSYVWNTGATTSQILTDIVTRKYLLTADNHGCSNNGTLFVKVLTACLIRVPGAFTPNNDGLNDKLRAVNADLATHFSLKIYNRYGQLLFSTTNPVEGWDGNYKGIQAETGTYVWQLQYNDPWTHKIVYDKGTSILLR